MELTHYVQVRIMLEHKPYFSDSDYNSRATKSIAYYLRKMYLFQYKDGFSLSPHLRLLLLDAQSRSQGLIDASPYRTCGGKK
jgi:hypothetical protein